MISWDDDRDNYKKSLYEFIPPKKGDIDYIIEEERKIICFGNPGYITRWELFTSHGSDKEERDRHFESLNTYHPEIRFRKRDVDAYMGYIRR
jgi:hypothetical protein